MDGESKASRVHHDYRRRLERMRIGLVKLNLIVSVVEAMSAWTRVLYRLIGVTTRR